jgi:hypothetical protein
METFTSTGKSTELLLLPLPPTYGLINDDVSNWSQHNTQQQK